MSGSTRRTRLPPDRRVLEMIFETHALTVENERDIATGWNDGELSKAGERRPHREQRPVRNWCYLSIRLGPRMEVRHREVTRLRASR